MTQEGWHLRREVTIGNILASVVAILGMLGAFYTLDKRIELNAQKIGFVETTEAGHYKDVKDILNNIDRKIDRMIK